MNYYEVDALICLKDDMGIEYLISEIKYTVWENEEFEYRFRPNYSVIELLDPSLFQGIPGIDLDLKKNEYVRRNIVPTFISERSPSPNRQELWKLLEDCNMKHLNRLEWLIRTDTKYIGDPLYVRKPYIQSFSDIIKLDEELSELKRSCDIQRRLLDKICAGFTTEYDGFIIDDSNRKTCYNLLYRLYRQESERLKRLQRDGINKAEKDGKYQGRKPIDIDDTKLYEVWKKYKSKQITLEQAVTLLNISVSTFHRKTKKFAE